MSRAAFWTMTVKCLNPDCADHEAPRTVELVQLGEGVFHVPTTMSAAFGVPVLALGCGTCRQQRMAEVLG